MSTTNNLASHASPTAPAYMQITGLPLNVGAMPAHFAISVPEVACAWDMQDLAECSVLLQQLLQAEGYTWECDDVDSPSYPGARYLYVSYGAMTYGTLHGTYCANIAGTVPCGYGAKRTGICMEYLSEKCVREYLESRAEYAQE